MNDTTVVVETELERSKRLAKQRLTPFPARGVGGPIQIPDGVLTMIQTGRNGPEAVELEETPVTEPEVVVEPVEEAAAEETVEAKEAEGEKATEKAEEEKATEVDPTQGNVPRPYLWYAIAAVLAIALTTSLVPPRPRDRADTVEIASAISVAETAADYVVTIEWEYLEDLHIRGWFQRMRAESDLRKAHRTILSLTAMYMAANPAAEYPEIRDLVIPRIKELTRK